MVRYLFFDQGSARHTDFSAQIESPETRLVFGDVYFAEFSRAAAPTLVRQMERVAPYRARVFAAIAATQAMNREVATLKRVNHGHIISSRFTVWLREALGNPASLADLVTQPEHRRMVMNDRYSDTTIRPRHLGMAQVFQNAMRRAGVSARSGAAIAEEEFPGLIEIARYAVFKYLRDDGRIDVVTARRFALGDSFLFRNAAATLCRAADWAHTNGIGGLSDEQLYNEHMDLEYITVGSYFDEFLVVDKRSSRNDENLRRLLRAAPRVRRIRGD